MAFKHGTPNSIVTDGLVFCVDAANIKSYPRSGTTVTNLINNTAGTIDNAVDFNSNNLGYWEFDSIDDLINPGTVFTDTTSKTLACWFNPASFQSGNTRHMISKWNAGSSKRVIQLNMSNATPIFFVSSNGTSFGSISYSRSGGTITANDWYYLVGIYDSVNQKIKIGLNRQLLQQVSYTAGMVSDSTTNLNIGGQNDAGTFLGDISMVQIYNKALTQEEIFQNYDALKYRFRT